MNGLVTGLPFCAAFRVVFTFTRTTAALRPALMGGLARLGGLPSGLVFDNDAAIVASRAGGRARLVDEVAALLGQLAIKPIPLRRRSRKARGSSSGRSVIWRPRFCRCAPSPTWPICKRRPTSGRSRSLTRADHVGLAARSATRWRWNATRCGAYRWCGLI